MARGLVVLALLLAGCPTPDPKQGIDPTVSLDYNQFVCAVQPVLIRRCSYLACHGQPLHALRIYSPGKLRQTDDGTRNTRDAVLTANEVELNFESASGLVVTATAAQRAAADLQNVLLLGKPVARRAGGAEHHGVAIFPVYPAKTLSDDPEFVALSLWVQGQAQPKPVDAACADVFNTLGLTPK